MAPGRLQALVSVRSRSARHGEYAVSCRRVDSVNASKQDRAHYVSFWDDVAAHFSALEGAPSTQYYFACKQVLCDQFFPPLGRRLFKTDLWGEAKNSDTLRWAIEQGAGPRGDMVTCSPT